MRASAIQFLLLFYDSVLFHNVYSSIEKILHRYSLIISAQFAMKIFRKLLKKEVIYDFYDRETTTVLVEA